MWVVEMRAISELQGGNDGLRKKAVYQEYLTNRYHEINDLIKEFAEATPTSLKDVKALIYLYSTFAQYCFLPKCMFDKLF